MHVRRRDGPIATATSRRARAVSRRFGSSRSSSVIASVIATSSSAPHSGCSSLPANPPSDRPAPRQVSPTDARIVPAPATIAAALSVTTTSTTPTANSASTPITASGNRRTSRRPIVRIRFDSRSAASR